MAEIRKAYSAAMDLAKKNQAADTKNTQVFQAVQTDDNGVWNRRLEFIYDLDYFEELEVYTPELVLIRQSNNGFLQEFLYDDDGELMFVFERSDPEDDDETMEYRYYYDEKGAPFWKIEKRIDLKTKKTLSTEQGRISESDEGWFETRVAADLRRAFEVLNVMYD